jgi:Septum formation
VRHVLVAVLVALSITACGGGTAVDEVGVGDCFDDPETELVAALELIDCSLPHDNEVYAEVLMPGSQFPGDEEIAEFGFDACLAEFEGYVGESYVDSPLDYLFLSPSAESWDGGDRAFLCFLYSADLAKLTGSQRG